MSVSSCSNAVFDTVKLIRKELRRVMTKETSQYYNHFLTAVENEELAPWLILTRTHDRYTSITTHLMKDRRTGKAINKVTWLED